MSEIRIYDIGDQVQLEGYCTTSACEGAIGAGENSLLVSDPSLYAGGDTLIVSGAGAVGGDLVTTISSISGFTCVLAATAASTVRRARVAKLVDPTTVTVQVRTPAGALTSVSASKLSTGRYRGVYTTLAAGDHFYRYVGSGSYIGSEEQQFTVRSERV